MVNYEELLAENNRLKFEIAQLKKLIYGAKSERFKKAEVAAGQLDLFAQQEEVSKPEPEEFAQTQKISYERKKGKKKPKGAHSIPDHLPTREVIIEPEEDTTGMTCIGEQVTETLEYSPASLVKVITRRPKYVVKEAEDSPEEETRIIIGELPTRPIDKSIAEASLLAYIMICKFIDHLPFYRQQQIFKRDFGWHPAKSTISDWHKEICALLEPLYNLMKQKLLASTYIQADESPIKVQDRAKKGRTHRGFMWIYRSTVAGIVLFNYHKSRSIQAPKELLQAYSGWLQCDGYAVYDKLEKIYPDIRLAGCWVHARRGFDKAKDSDPQRAHHALSIFAEIYKHEAICKDYTAEQRLEYRGEHTLPLVKELKSWIDQQARRVLPKSPIGKAITYCLNQWPKLMRCLEDSRLQLDNNLIENKIRPLALGRKNYLFAGSHDAGQRIAMMYSFFATCKIHDVNPREWLTFVLQNIKDTKLSQLETLLPHNFKM